MYFPPERGTFVQSNRTIEGVQKRRRWPLGVKMRASPKHHGSRAQKQLEDCVRTCSQRHPECLVTFEMIRAVFRERADHRAVRVFARA